MEKLIQKLLAVTGIFIGGAIALVPLSTSYATTAQSCGATQTETITPGDTTSGAEPEWTNTGSTNVCVYVDSAIAVQTAGSAEDTTGTNGKIKLYPNTISEGYLNAKVRSAYPYQITLHSDFPELHDATETYMIPTRAQLVQGKNGWGIQTAAQMADTTKKEYTPLSDAPKVFATSTTAADDFVMHNFVVGISVNSMLPKGEYTTTVVLTVVPQS